MMISNKKKQEFIDALKFAPIKVTLNISGYGGESYAGTVDRKIYDYFKDNQYSIEEYAGDWDGEWFDRIPESLQPFNPGSPYDCDNLWHASGAELSDHNLITITDETGKEIWSQNLGHSDLEDCGVTVEQGGGCELDDLEDGTVIFNGAQGEKGCFFDAEFILRAPFNPKKLKIIYENCDGWYLVSGVEYEGEELDGHGGYSTTGKWGESKWILLSDEEVYESVSIEDREDWDPAEELDKVVKGNEEYLQEAVDALNETFADELATTTKSPEEIMYGLSEWFPKDINPIRKGNYEVMIDAPWPNGGPGMAEWSGRSWKKDGKKVAIHQWRGLAREPYEG